MVCVGQDVCIGAGIEQGDYLGGEAVLCGVDQFAIECLRRGDLRLEGFVFSIDDGNDFESVQGQENGADDQDDARKGTAFLVVSMVRYDDRGLFFGVLVFALARLVGRFRLSFGSVEESGGVFGYQGSE